MTYGSSLLRLLDERGYLHQVTDAAALDALAQKEVVTAYIGFVAMISSFPARPREWNSSASSSVYLTLLSDMVARVSC